MPQESGMQEVWVELPSTPGVAGSGVGERPRGSRDGSGTVTHPPPAAGRDP